MRARARPGRPRADPRRRRRHDDRPEVLALLGRGRTRDEHADDVGARARRRDVRHGSRPGARAARGGGAASSARWWLRSWSLRAARRAGRRWPASARCSPSATVDGARGRRRRRPTQVRAAAPRRAAARRWPGSTRGDARDARCEDLPQVGRRVASSAAGRRPCASWSRRAAPVAAVPASGRRLPPGRRDRRGVRDGREARPRGCRCCACRSATGRRRTRCAAALAVLDAAAGRLRVEGQPGARGPPDDVRLRLAARRPWSGGARRTATLKAAVLAVLSEHKASVYDVSAPHTPVLR